MEESTNKYKSYVCKRHLFCKILIFFAILNQILSQQSYDGGDWNPPWKDFDNSVVRRTYYGDVKGFSVPWHMEDEAWNPEWDDQPKWYIQRVNCFLGIPYAEAPLGYQRFQRPRRPRWADTWDATYFRHSCPQDMNHVRKDIPSFPKQNISEDCLYMNIYAPNITWHSEDTLYPVVVFVHGGEFIHGTSQIYPGQVLVKQEIVVVTFNYRLGALGFLTTEDEHGQGNWGLFDMHLALEFIRENIRAFKGDPRKITLMGDGAGASSVGHIINSPVTRDKGYFHAAIMMSGSDMARSGFIDPFWRPHEYGKRLAKHLNCPVDESHAMLTCLRNNKTIRWEDIVKAQALVYPNNGPLGEVWGPVQDGGYYTPFAFIPEQPVDLRRQQTFADIPIIIGLNQQDGTVKADRNIKGLGDGLFTETFDQFLADNLRTWKVMNRYWQRAKEAILFQYTYWPDPENRTARAQEFINMITDIDYGTGMDATTRYHAKTQDAFQYVWSYKSTDDYLPHWMGSTLTSQIPYVFGYPFMNETVLNETELVMKQWYNWDDKNMSDCTMIIWSNFIKYKIPTPNETCNATWIPFQDHNHTYLIMDYHKHMWFRYRQNKYGFWNYYFPSIAKQDYLRPTATPTPMGYEFVYSTGSLSVVLAILLAVLVVFIFLLINQSRREKADEEFYARDLPFSFTGRKVSNSTSTISVTSGREPQVPQLYDVPQLSQSEGYGYHVPYSKRYYNQRTQSQSEV